MNPVRAGIVRKPDEWKWSSYSGTAGQRKPHPCLTADRVLGQFGKRKQQAQKKYKEYVRAGIGGERIWKEVRGQSILGKEDFAGRLIEYVKGYRDIKEIPRSQRYAGRPGFDGLFDEETKGDRKKQKKKV